MARILAVATSLVAAAALGVGIYALASSDGTRAVVRQVTVTSSQPTAATRSLSVTDVYNRAAKGVVEITISSMSASPFPYDNPRSRQAQGSGFVYDAAGHIVTNQH